jgi:hypothetical protein
MKNSSQHIIAEVTHKRSRVEMTIGIDLHARSGKCCASAATIKSSLRVMAFICEVVKCETGLNRSFFWDSNFEPARWFLNNPILIQGEVKQLAHANLGWKLADVLKPKLTEPILQLG